MISIEPAHVHDQIPDRIETVKRGQGNGVLLQVCNFRNAGQAFFAIDFAGTGSTGRVMAGMTVHQGVVLFETNFFKTFQHAHVRANLKGKILKPGRIDPVRFISQDSKCHGFSCHGDFYIG
jgi:hypothetical protein